MFAEQIKKTENAIREIEGIDEFVVLSNKEQNGLVAFFALSPEKRPEIGRLLLSIHVPSSLRIVFLEELPKLPDGNMDLDKLYQI